MTLALYTNKKKSNTSVYIKARAAPAAPVGGGARAGVGAGHRGARMHALRRALHGLPPAAPLQELRSVFVYRTSRSGD